MRCEITCNAKRFGLVGWVCREAAAEDKPFEFSSQNMCPLCALFIVVSVIALSAAKIKTRFFTKKGDNREYCSW